MRQVALRVSWSLGTLLFVYILAFLLLHAVPGDPLERLGDPAMTPESAERTRQALGLDRPLLDQAATALRALVSGDAGVSFTRGRPVRDVLAGALPPTLMLCGFAVIAAYAVSLLASSALAFASARAQELAERAALLVGTLPRFWLGLMLVLLFHDGLGWLPASHAAPALGSSRGAWLAHLVLPVICLALPAGATLLRLQVAALREGLASGVARQSHLAGLTRGRIVYRDGVRPLLGFLATLLALDLPALVSGALVVEVVFAWPGMGRVVADALLGGDYPLALGGTMLIALAVVVSNLVADFARSYLDPRQQGASSGEVGA